MCLFVKGFGQHSGLFGVRGCGYVRGMLVGGFTRNTSIRGETTGVFFFGFRKVCCSLVGRDEEGMAKIRGVLRGRKTGGRGT